MEMLLDFELLFRGIDLILEAGMNVKVCTFPDGDDPDSFARKTSYEDLLQYFENNIKTSFSLKRLY